MDRSVLDEKNFERQVIRICDQVFAPFTKKETSYLVGGIEHDAYYETDLIVHVVEATVSNRKAKASDDLNKLERRINQLNRELRGKKVVRGWFITKHSLPAEQRALLRNYPSTIQHEDFQTFLARIIDSSTYLSARSNYRFGSAVDLFNGSQKFDRELFVETSLRRRGTGKRRRPIKLNILKSWLDSGQVSRVLIEGDFGSGKSMHMRELFLHMAKRHTSGQEEAFPIALNLRDFANLETPDEALRRHADRIGVRNIGDALIRAWRAGYVSLLIDGYDEMVPRLSLRKGERYFDIRRQALLVVRRFISESPDTTKIVLAGRTHFFSNFEEAVACLGIADNWEHLSLEDLATEDELQSFLQKYSARFSPPNWVPRRPLLLGYLAVLDAKKNLGEISSLNAAEGWKLLLEKFCQREVDQLDMLPLVKEDLIEIYGDLATIARKRSAGIGPITTNDLADSYRNLFGDEPEGVALGQLMRLPGLVHAEAERFESVQRQSGVRKIDTKNFISKEFVDVCSATYLSRLSNDYADYRLTTFIGLKNSLGDTGVEALGTLIANQDSASRLLAYVNSKARDNHAQIDIIQGLIFFGVSYRGQYIVISNCDISSLRLEKIRSDYSRIEFNNCYFEEIRLDFIDDPSRLPNFASCACERMLCVGDQGITLPTFADCHVEIVENRESDLVDHSMTLTNYEERVVYDLLRKIYDQTGSGRVEKALLSGNPPHKHADVLGILRNLEKENVVVRAPGVSNDTIWKGIPGQAARVREFLDNPHPKFAKQFL